MQDEGTRKSISLVQKQFLCSVPTKEIIWKQLLNENTEIQRDIVNSTVRLPQVLQYPIKIDYQKTFLKHIIQDLEKQGSAVDDSVYVEYGRLVSLPVDIPTFKHYFFENCTTKNQSIILRESVQLILNGTTGLRTWQAALALSEWIIKNQAQFKDKTILELGSGIGLTGLTLALQCAPKTVYLTDCHPIVLETLQENLKLNNPTLCKVCVLNLLWQDVTLEFCDNNFSLDGRKIDKIIAADVVYDQDLFVPLLKAVECLFNNCQVEEFVLSCTERNTDTLNKFLELASDNFRIKELEVPPQEHFLWSLDCAVKIFSLKKI